jgi:hypothetical protein
MEAIITNATMGPMVAVVMSAAQLNAQTLAEHLRCLSLKFHMLGTCTRTGQYDYYGPLSFCILILYMYFSRRFYCSRCIRNHPDRVVVGDRSDLLRSLWKKSSIVMVLRFFQRPLINGKEGKFFFYILRLAPRLNFPNPAGVVRTR